MPTEAPMIVPSPVPSIATAPPVLHIEAQLPIEAQVPRSFSPPTGGPNSVPTVALIVVPTVVPLPVSIGAPPPIPSDTTTVCPSQCSSGRQVLHQPWRRHPFPVACHRWPITQPGLLVLYHLWFLAHPVPVIAPFLETLETKFRPQHKPLSSGGLCPRPQCVGTPLIRQSWMNLINSSKRPPNSSLKVPPGMNLCQRLGTHEETFIAHLLN
jgi:hypothetical protein